MHQLLLRHIAACEQLGLIESIVGYLSCRLTTVIPQGDSDPHRNCT